MSEAAQCFNESIKDAEALLARFDEEVKVDPKKKSEVLKRSALVMALASWETYVKDRIREEYESYTKCIQGSPTGRFLGKQLDLELRRFFNPNSERTKRIFKDFFEIDITEEWKWDNYHPSDVRKALDEAVGLRCEAAHEAYQPGNGDLINRKKLGSVIRFLKGLVGAMEKVKLV